MKLRIVLMTGSRHWTNSDVVFDVVSEEMSVATADGEALLIIHGDCETGADKILESICEEHGIHTARIAARWTMGRAAGPIRNRVMSSLPIRKAYAFLMRGAQNRGTRDCIKAVKAAGIEPAEVWDGPKEETTPTEDVEGNAH